MVHQYRVTKRTTVAVLPQYHTAHSEKACIARGLKTQGWIRTTTKSCSSNTKHATKSYLFSGRISRVLGAQSTALRGKEARAMRPGKKHRSGLLRRTRYAEEKPERRLVERGTQTVRNQATQVIKKERKRAMATVYHTRKTAAGCCSCGVKNARHPRKQLVHLPAVHRLPASQKRLAA